MFTNDYSISVFFNVDTSFDFSRFSNLIQGVGRTSINRKLMNSISSQVLAFRPLSYLADDLLNCGYTLTCSLRLGHSKHTVTKNVAKTSLVGVGLNCRQLLTVFFQESCFCKSFSFLVHVPQLEIVYDTHVVYILQVRGAELMATKDICVKYIHRSLSINQFHY